MHTTNQSAAHTSLARHIRKPIRPKLHQHGLVPRSLDGSYEPASAHTQTNHPLSFFFLPSSLLVRLLVLPQLKKNARLLVQAPQKTVFSVFTATLPADERSSISRVHRKYSLVPAAEISDSFIPMCKTIPASAGLLAAPASKVEYQFKIPVSYLPSFFSGVARCRLTFSHAARA
jgi:hypothetical protein